MMPFFLQAQLSYTPIVIGQCSGEEIEFYTFSLEGEGTIYSTDWNVNSPQKTLLIKDTGIYELSIGMLGVGEEIKRQVRLTSFKAYTDTFYTASLKYNACICSPPAQNYFLCGDDPDGLVFDYYHDGSVRAKGNFSKGYIVDSLIKYHRNGAVKYTKVKLKGEKMLDGVPIPLWEIKRFSEDGKLISHYNNKAEFDKDYFENGRLKMVSHFSGKTKEYYESGKLKSVINKKGNKKTEYSEAGKKLVVWKSDYWTEEYDYIQFTETGKIKSRARLKPFIGVGPGGFPRNHQDVVTFVEGRAK